MTASGAPLGSGPEERPGPSTIRLLLADPHRSFVEALAMRLAGEADVEVVATVADPEETVRLATAMPVDVAVLAVGAGRDFIDAGRTMRQHRPALGLVAVAEDDDVAFAVRAVRSGFRGWVPKELGVTTLLEGVRAVCRGETSFPPLLLSRVLSRLVDDRREQQLVEHPFAVLTSRELEVLTAMARGATRPEIAAELAISAHTVRTHVQNIMTKLGVHTSLAAVAKARRAGLS